MAGLGVVQAHAIDEHEHLTEIRAAHGEVALHAGNATHPDVDRGRQPQRIGHRLHRQPRDLLAGDDRHPAGDRAQLDRPGRRGHHDRLPETVLGKRRLDHQQDASQGQRPLVPS